MKEERNLGGDKTTHRDLAVSLSKKKKKYGGKVKVGEDV